MSGEQNPRRKAINSARAVIKRRGIKREELVVERNRREGKTLRWRTKTYQRVRLKTVGENIERRHLEGPGWTVACLNWPKGMLIFPESETFKWQSRGLINTVNFMPRNYERDEDWLVVCPVCHGTGTIGEGASRKRCLKCDGAGKLRR